MIEFWIPSARSLRNICATVLTALVAVTADGVVRAVPSYAQAVAVRDIKVTGNRRIEPETVRSYLKFSVGDAYSASKVDASIKALFATGLFSDVRIDRDGAGVLVTVVENPIINQVAFEGNSEVDAATLQAEVQLKPRSVFTRSKAQGDVQRILDVYRRQGRFAASVQPKLIELEQNRVNVVYEITEGGATKVKGISFSGNRAFSDSQLRDIVSTSQAGLFDFLKGTSVYDPDRVSLDRELLRQYYLKNGYADANVVAGNAELAPDGSGFFITYTIEEGTQYTFGTVAIESALPSIQTSKLNAEMLTLAGDIYNASLVDKTVEKLTLAVAEQGFAFARVRPRATPDAAARTISISYQVDEGPRIYIERIDVVGNARTKDYVIRREFRLAEGDAYNPLLVDRAKKRLQGLGFFKTVEVKRRNGSAPDRVVLDVELVEQSTGELSFGAGYSTSEGVIGDVSITERNLLGNGQFLRLKVGGSLERAQVDLSFTEPRFLDQNLSAGFDLFYKQVDQTSSSGFKNTTAGGSLRLGFPLSENLWAQTTYTLAQNNIDVPTSTQDKVSIAILEAATRNGGDSLTSSVGASLTYDARNHPKNPTRGYFFQVASEFAGVGGDVQFVRLTGEARAYYPVTEKITLVGRLTGGHIEGWGSDDVLLTDLFFRGGETIRGFNKSGYGPRDVTTGDALGGKTFWAANAEVRFPFPLVPDELGMSGAVFADAGSLFCSTDNATSLSKTCGRAITVADNVANGRAVGRSGVCLKDEASIRASVGASLIWNSPVGPLRLDFAKALLSEDYDKEQFFRFGASTKF